MSDHSHILPRPRGTLRIILIGLLLFLLGAVATMYVRNHFNRPDEYEAKRVANRIKIRTDLEADAKEKLTKTGWVDQGKGIVRIPLDDAIALEIDTLKTKPPHPAAYAVGAPVPLPPGFAPAPAPAAPAATPLTSTAAKTTTPATPPPATTTASAPAAAPATTTLAAPTAPTTATPSQPAPKH